MSTKYLLRHPMSLTAVENRSGWKHSKSQNETFLADRFDNWVEVQTKGRLVIGFTRYRFNNVAELVDALDAVASHSYRDPDYAKLFGREPSQQEKAYCF